jgi:hypothetical protein
MIQLPNTTILASGIDTNQWKEAFMQTVQRHENAELLRAAALDERLADWTACLTRAVVKSCDRLGWMSAAMGNKLDSPPVPHSEYLTMDVMAFAHKNTGNFNVL